MSDQRRQQYPQQRAYGGGYQHQAEQYAQQPQQHGYLTQYASYQQPYYSGPYPNQQYQHENSINHLQQRMAHTHLDTNSYRAYDVPRKPDPVPRRSSISLRYPALREIPPRTPAAESSDAAAREYIESLQRIIRVYEERDQILRLRTEAVGFEPKRAYQAWSGEAVSETNADETHPILGVRLLQRVDQLTRENEELGQALEQKVDARIAIADARESELAAAKNEIADCHRLIQSLDQALTKAEERASVADQALQVACASNSTSIITSDTPDQVSAPKKQQANPARATARPPQTNGRAGKAQYRPPNRRPGTQKPVDTS